MRTVVQVTVHVHYMYYAALLVYKVHCRYSVITGTCSITVVHSALQVLGHYRYSIVLLVYTVHCSCRYLASLLKYFVHYRFLAALLIYVLRFVFVFVFGWFVLVVFSSGLF